MAQHVPQLPWHLPMLHPVPAACALLMRGTAVRALRSRIYSFLGIGARFTEAHHIWPNRSCALGIMSSLMCLAPVNECHLLCRNSAPTQEGVCPWQYRYRAHHTKVCVSLPERFLPSRGVTSIHMRARKWMSASVTASE
jgi:hypothetical protein